MVLVSVLALVLRVRLLVQEMECKLLAILVLDRFELIENHDQNISTKIFTSEKGQK